jgi:hypothetical protein
VTTRPHRLHLASIRRGQETAQMTQPARMMITRLICAFGLGVAVLHGFSSVARAAYQGVPPEVPSWRGIVGTICAIVVGLLLYALRCHKRLYYGMLEVISESFRIYFNIAPASQSGSTVCNGTVLWGLGCSFQRWLIILAGIYIFVRGMDNIGQGLPSWVPHSIRRSWHRVFPPEHHPTLFRV